MDFLSKTNKDGRFPSVERRICEPEAALTGVQLSPSDGVFLAENLPNMPGDDLPHAPVTLDVNSTVAVRVQGQDPENRMELAQIGATCRGKPIRVVANRAYLIRAVRLGFHRFHLFGKQSALMAADDYRRYVWMPVEPKMAVEPAENITRIESPTPGTVSSVGPPRPRIERNNNTPMPSPSATSNKRNGKARAAGNGSTNGRARSESDNGQVTSAIKQIIALRTTFREPATQATVGPATEGRETANPTTPKRPIVAPGVTAAGDLNHQSLHIDRLRPGSRVLPGFRHRYPQRMFAHFFRPSMPSASRLVGHGQAALTGRWRLSISFRSSERKVPPETNSTASTWPARSASRL